MAKTKPTGFAQIVSNSHKKTTASAPAKVILFGEHAVVYGRPAIAVPVSRVRAEATVENTDQALTIVASDLGFVHRWGEVPRPELDPLVALVQAILERLEITEPPPLRITIHSSIPMARGMGSGAAVSTAVVRALSQHLGRNLETEDVSHLVFQAERFYHGTPSGIDNTVIAYERPVYFIRGQEPEIISMSQPLHLLIADSGVVALTKEVVADVRRGWEKDQGRYEHLFDQISEVVAQARKAMSEGDWPTVGRLMSQNHSLLQALEISSPLLDKLVEAAKGAGAEGAKLSGAGRGGNIIALVDATSKIYVEQALVAAGAQSTVFTTVA